MQPEAPAPAPPERRTRLVRNDGKIDAVVLGLKRSFLSDTYYGLLSAPWAAVLGLVAGIYVALNALFALVYVLTGGIEGARAGSFVDAFFFSVQTMATIGYGVMHPTTPLANVLVTMEALLGLLGVAMATGVLFAKFARPSSQLVFSNVAVVGMREGVPCLMFRVANVRVNHVAEATMKVALVRNERTLEGERVRRWHDLPLQRSYSPIFALTWSVIHPIDESSLLFGMDHDKLVGMQAELIVTLVGLDATLAATIHARHSYMAEEILWGARFADIMGGHPDGRRVIDFGKFHDTLPMPLPAPGAQQEKAAAE